jgi:hypothetical protein
VGKFADKWVGGPWGAVVHEVGVAGVDVRGRVAGAVVLTAGVLGAAAVVAEVVEVRSGAAVVVVPLTRVMA